MWEKPIQKEDIASGTGKRERRRVGQHLLRDMKLPLRRLLVWVRSSYPPGSTSSVPLACVASTNGIQQAMATELR